MAKSDFCFTYYDGDAARDMAHMNRLERGAYSDIIISQRKFGHLTKDQIKKILGKDFDDCFGAVELVLKKDEKSLYYIEWLETSEKKAKTHSKRQSQNRTGSTKQQPNNNQTEPNDSKIQPLKDGDENGDVVENEEWLKWGAQILKKEDQYWEQMKGREISQAELDNFISVATRCEWTMDTQQSFRTTLKGFTPFTSNAKSKTKTLHNLSIT